MFHTVTTVCGKRFSVFSLHIRAFLIFLAGIVLLHSHPAAALTNTHPIFEHMTIDDGLSHNTVTAQLQDKSGYLWFGTMDGLNRYDGYVFREFQNDPDDDSSISSNFILSLFEDSNGGIWAGTYRGGICRFDPVSGGFERFMHDPDNPESIGSDDVGPIIADEHNRLWIGLREGLDMFDPETGTFTHFRHDPEDEASLINNTIHSLLLDSDGTLWVGTVNGLDMFDPETETFSHIRLVSRQSNSPKSLTIRKLFRDAAGVLWVGTDSGLYKKDTESDTFTVYRHKPSDPSTIGDDIVLSCYESYDGTFFVGTSFGLDIMDRANGTFQHFQNDPIDHRTISDNWIKTIICDRTGILWFGTNGGINKLDPVKSLFNHTIRHPINKNSLSHNYIRSICGDIEGNIWIATDAGGLNQYSPQTGIFRHFRYSPRNSDGITSDWTTVVYVDRENTIWVGTGEGLCRYDRTRDTFRHYVHAESDTAGISHNWILSILEDSDGALWVGTGNGLNRLDKATGKSLKFFHNGKNPATLCNSTVRCLAEDADGMLWVGTDGGLNRIDRKKCVVERIDAPPFGGKKIHALALSGAGSLWAGTTRGLFNFDTKSGKYSILTADDGLPGNTINALIFDDKGRLWITTNSGMASLDTAAGTIQVFNAADGLQSNQFSVNACWKEPDGEIYVGGVNGFNRFHPDSLFANNVVPPVVITSFKKFNESISFLPAIMQTKPLVFKHDENYLTIEFAALDFRVPQKNIYAYKLEGLDKDWIDAGTRRFASYSGIPAGRYTFHVKAANSYGVWNDNGASVKVTILPPFWGTIWFRVLMVLSFVGLVEIIYLYRIRSVKQKKNELEQMVAERTAELRQRTEDLNRERQRLFTMLDSLPAFVMLQDENFAIRFANQALKNQFPNLNDLPCYEVFHGLKSMCEHCPTKEFFETKSPLSHEWNPLNGRTYHMSVYPFDDIDGTPLVLKLAADITDRKKTELDRIRTEKMQVVLEMAGAACHEFNQPLQVISGYMELLQHGGDIDEVRKTEWLRKIDEQIDRMKRISDTLKKITRYKTKDYYQGKKIIDIEGSIE